MYVPDVEGSFRPRLAADNRRLDRAAACQEQSWPCALRDLMPARRSQV